MSTAQIGFLADWRSYNSESITCRDAAEQSDTLYEYDSGRRIPLIVGTRSVLITGGTGAGKTRSVVLPIIDNLVKNNLPGLIIDVKGNLRNQVRSIAAANGRLGDIVEFGTHQTAHNTNFLSGLEEYEVSEIMDELASESTKDDRNKHFFLHGARIYHDVWRCLRDISMIHPRCHFSKQFKPTLEKIFKIVNNQPLATGLWSFYKETIFAETNRYNNINKEPPQNIIDAQSFIKQVDSDNFHVLRGYDKEFNNTYYEQLSYALNHINRSFKLLEVTHNLLHRFSATSNIHSVPIDFNRLIYKDKKIVLIHFSIDSGVAGQIISKSIKTRYYQSVIKNGLTAAQPTFLVADEFQHIIDVSHDKRLNDVDFFSLSREYGNINIIATQSISSLRSKGDHDSINSFITNCMTKIYLQSTDIETEKLISNNNFNTITSLRELKQGECLTETYNKNNALVLLKETVNYQYKYIQKILNNYKDTKISKNLQERPPYRLGAGLFPRVISDILMSEIPNLENRRKQCFNYKNYSTKLYDQLNHLRELSKSGIAYWKKEKRQIEEEELLP